MIVIIIVVCLVKKESFTNISSEIPKSPLIASIGSVAKNTLSPASGLPLFLDQYPHFGQDFNLTDLINRLRVNNTVYVPNGIGTIDRTITESKKLPPIILVPGLGASTLYSMNSNENNWDIVWPPKSTKDEWVKSMDNTRIKEVGTIDLANDDYMDTLMEALEVCGYRKGVNLFVACYDPMKIGTKEEIDKWGLSLSRLVEHSTSFQGHSAIIIGHDLGSVVANYFLVNSKKEWKDRFINKFITISGAFGGCPKALRAVLSGSNDLNFDKVARKMTGLSLMLPNPMIYGDATLVEYNGEQFSSKDLDRLIGENSEEGPNKGTLKDVEHVRKMSMNAPGVDVYIIAGTDINTESFYKYDMATNTEPHKNVPFYRIDMPANQRYHYPDLYDGDGTMPKIALEYPITWTKYQQEPVFYRFFGQQEHTKIMASYYPVEYILNICDLI
jgi:hypothetical protein